MTQAMFRFRKTAPALAVGMALALGACGGGGGNDAGPVVNATEVRTSTALLQDWKFVQDDTITDDAALASNGASWSSVSLPHTWNATDAATTAQTTPTSANYKRGLGWYRLEFDNTGTGASRWLQFDGASIVADVWLNGQKLGQHKGAFTRFRFDVTGKLVAGKNVLLVKTDNRAAANGASPTAIMPLAGDFNMSGGLYRGVSLVATPNAAHFALDDFGGSGIFAKTTAVSSGNATVNVRAKLKNDSAADGNYTVQAALLDASGNTVKVVQKSIAVKAGAAAELAQDLGVDKAHLWQGIDDPYLYQLVAELKDSAGTTLDKVVQGFGIREMRFDANDGFFLNGKSMPLHGVNMHQDYIGKAWAIGTAETDESLGLIKEIGANTIRLAHYPHAQYTYEQADKLGFVIWAELPYVNQALTAADCATTSTVPAAFIANARQQLQELIRQQYNHASIGMWSIANEVGFGAKCLGNDIATPLLHELHSVAKAEDSSRVTTLADLSEGLTSVPGAIPAFATGGITDIWALNRYFMWYYEKTADPMGSILDTVHAKYPGQPVGVSEYGAGAALTHQTDNPLGGIVANFDFSGKTRTLYQPEGYASFVHEQNYAAMASRSFVWGTYVWNMFDFGSGVRHEGDIGGTNTKGLVTFDRKTKKDPFFFYKANWSKDPVTYVTGRRYTERAYPVADVKVYSNADSVKLTVNGTVVGTMTAAQCAWKTCVFPNVALTAGANSIVAEGSHAGKAVTNTVSWNLGSDNASNIYVAAGQPATGFTSSTGHRYGSDNFFTGGDGTPLKLDGFWGGLFNTVVANVADANDKMLWASVRRGSFSYDVPLANGSYAVTLGFLEPSTTATLGSRVFSVDANGVNQIASLDVLSAAGAHSTAITRTFNVAVSNGKLKLDFKPSVGEAVVSNIAITKQ